MFDRQVTYENVKRRVSELTEMKTLIIGLSLVVDHPERRTVHAPNNYWLEMLADGMPASVTTLVIKIQISKVPRPQGTEGINLREYLSLVKWDLMADKLKSKARLKEVNIRIRVSSPLPAEVGTTEHIREWMEDLFSDHVQGAFLVR